MLVRTEDETTLEGYEWVGKGDSVSTVRASQIEVCNGLSMISVYVEIYCFFLYVKYFNVNDSRDSWSSGLVSRPLVLKVWSRLI